MEKIIYIGSFDPFHNGHKEAIDLMQDRGQVIIMPNAPRKGKPNRTPIMVRAFALSKQYPLFLGYNQWKDQSCRILIDNLPVREALSELTVPYSAIIGSDITSLPKYRPQKWYIIERVGYPIDQHTSSFHGVPAEVITLAEKYYRKYCSLSDKLKDHIFELPITTILNAHTVETVAIKDAKTLFDLIRDSDLDIPKLFIRHLNALHYEHQFKPWCHGDLSVTNIIYTDRFYLIDYETFQDGCAPGKMINDYYQLLSSIRFYGRLKGYNLDKELMELQDYGKVNYTFQDQYPAETHVIKKKWMSRQ